MFRKLAILLAASFLLWSGASAAAERQARDRDSRAIRNVERGQAEGQVDETIPELKPRVPQGLDAPVDPDTYVIGPSDEFILVLRGPIEKEEIVKVLPEGTIILPGFGALAAAGLTITEFRGKLAEALGGHYKNIQFDWQLRVPRSFVVYVLGEVERPGAVDLHAPFRLSAAIEAAEGLTEKGSLRFIEIREQEKAVSLVDLFSFLQLGKMDEDPVLHEGQSVFVPARRASASIFGEVWNGGTYEFRAGETISDLIDFAHGPTPYSDSERVTLERHDSGGTVSVRSVPEDEFGAVELQDRDIVLIPDRRTFEGGGFVQLRGGGGREGKVYLQENETLASFIPRFIRLGEGSDLNRAVIERRGPDGTATYIPVDLEKIIKGEEAGDIPLRNGDVISVPPAEELVYVTGEVTDPGEVPFQRGLNAERYIALAGGATRAGGMDKLNIVSRQGTHREGDRNSPIFRGDTIVVRRTTLSYVGPVFIGLTSLTSLVLSVIAVTQ